jgi:hypothetical protein
MSESKTAARMADITTLSELPRQFLETLYELDELVCKTLRIHDQAENTVLVELMKIQHSEPAVKAIVALIANRRRHRIDALTQLLRDYPDGCGVVM